MLLYSTNLVIEFRSCFIVIKIYEYLFNFKSSGLALIINSGYQACYVITIASVIMLIYYIIIIIMLIIRVLICLLIRMTVLLFRMTVPCYWRRRERCLDDQRSIIMLFISTNRVDAILSCQPVCLSPGYFSQPPQLKYSWATHFYPFHIYPFHYPTELTLLPPSYPNILIR